MGRALVRSAFRSAMTFARPESTAVTSKVAMGRNSSLHRAGRRGKLISLPFDCSADGLLRPLFPAVPHYLFSWIVLS
jgi:hypothetical protein